VKLAVAGAFHTRLMSSAVPKLEAALAATEFRAPKIPVISNVDAQPHSDPEVIKAILSQQVRTLTSPHSIGKLFKSLFQCILGLASTSIQLMIYFVNDSNHCFSEELGEKTFSRT
jgi:acyl transferase domain-containing protein